MAQSLGVASFFVLLALFGRGFVVVKKTDLCTVWFGCAGRWAGVAGWLTAFCRKRTAGFLGRRVPPQVGLPPNLVLQQQQTNFAQPALEIEEGNRVGKQE